MIYKKQKNLILYESGYSDSVDLMNVGSVLEQMSQHIFRVCCWFVKHMVM